MAQLLPTTKLGTSDLTVTRACLGTMTFGIQVNEELSHQLLDYAIKERGINFIDTAEIYPSPNYHPNYVPGNSERIIGDWIAKNPDWRPKIVIATKVIGYAESSPVPGARTFPPGPAQPARLDYHSVKQACNASLRRLQTNYIDLYQIHWPDRYVPNFGPTSYNPSQERESIPISETLRALSELHSEGKIRYYGLSNESTFGVCEWCHTADSTKSPRPVTIQNSFSLVHRSFETDLAEACSPRNFNISLLPWSPLAGGILTGKYTGQDPENARFTLWSTLQSFQNNLCRIAAEKYKKIADKAGLSLTQLALAWCNSRWYVGSTILGCTSISQLKENIDAFQIVLDKDTLNSIDQVHLECKDPAMGV